VLLIYFENLLLKQRVLKTKRFILLFETFCYVLQLNSAFNIALFIRLNSSLEFSQLRLLPFSKCTLCSTILNASSSVVSLLVFSLDGRNNLLFWFAAGLRLWLDDPFFGR